jgi:hypothetical protein
MIWTQKAIPIADALSVARGYDGAIGPPVSYPRTVGQGVLRLDLAAFVGAHHLDGSKTGQR